MRSLQLLVLQKCCWLLLRSNVCKCLEWNQFHQVLHKMRHQNRHKYRMIQCQPLFFSYVTLDQDSSIYFIIGFDWFLEVVLSLDESLWRYCQEVLCLLGWTFRFLFFVDRIAFCIFSTNFGKVVLCYWVAMMGWLIQNINLECGSYKVVMAWSSGVWW